MQNTLWNTSQQDPLWPTSQNIGNKSKNKQMDSKGLNIETNDIRNTLESNASDNLLNKKFELKTETYNNNTMIPKNITENFGTIILQKKMKLFNFSNEIEENDINIDTNKIKGKTEQINKNNKEKIFKRKEVKSKTVIYRTIPIPFLIEVTTQNNNNTNSTRDNLI